MLLNGGSFGLAALFTAIAVLTPLGLGWWLYGSRMTREAGPAATPSSRQSVLLACVLGLSACLHITGGWWDASQHIRTGEIPGGADFLWPPHIAMYSSFFISFLVALFTIGLLAASGRAAGARDPRVWFRRNPFLGLIALFALYAVLSVPGDAIWHELFGVDLTAWSPPHFMLTFSGAALPLGAAGLMQQGRSGARNPVWVDLGSQVLIAVGLNVAWMGGVVEYEAPGLIRGLVLNRPEWAYPVVSGVLGCCGLLIARYAVRGRFSATIMAAVALLIRAIVAAALGVTGQVVPALPVVLVPAALVLDLLYRDRTGLSFGQSLTELAGYLGGFLAVAVPTVLLRPELPQLTPAGWLLAVGLTAAGALLVAPLARRIGRVLRGQEVGAPAPGGVVAGD